MRPKEIDHGRFRPDAASTLAAAFSAARASPAANAHSKAAARQPHMMYAAAYGYFALLCALIVLVARTGRGPMFRTIFAIAINSFVANAYTLLSGDTDPWWLFMALDVITARIILYQPAGKVQSVIGWTYIAQIAMHSAYGLAVFYGQPDPINYWWMLTVVGLTQLLLVGGWWISGSRAHLLGSVRWLLPHVLKAWTGDEPKARRKRRTDDL